MSFSLGNKLKISVSGASHSEKICVKIEGLPVGEEIDMTKVRMFLDRRRGGTNPYSTPRKEEDIPIITSGLVEGTITDSVLEAEFLNKNVKREDYKNIKFVPRPSHGDYTGYVKYGPSMDFSGGGFFSGRMTLPMCFAGALALQLLEKQGILIGAHISSIGDICDDDYSPLEEDLEVISEKSLPVLNEEQGKLMEELLEKVRSEKDSIGGVIECKVVGIPAGIGDPIYDSLESKIAYGMFGIPAIKGIEFGKGFNITKLRGSEANDPFHIVDGEVKTKTNNSGGIQAGISNGMPILFKVAVKPTPSISKEQDSVDLVTKTNCKLTIAGRHDACIVPRAVPCVEAMCALMLYDAMTEE